jgi:arginyl-tRNA synthetase
MDIKAHLEALFREAIRQKIPEGADVELVFERPRDPAHGDLATNVAMQLARRLKRKPRELADLLGISFGRESRPAMPPSTR